jgi:hypothetical protein
MPGGQPTADDLAAAIGTGLPTRTVPSIAQGWRNTITGERRLKYDEIRAGGARSRTGDDEVVS